MAFNSQVGPSSQQPYSHFGGYAGHNFAAGFGSSQAAKPYQPAQNFDIAEWYPMFLSCQRYFLEHAQHSAPAQALAAFVNIQLPFQKPTQPMAAATSSSPRDPHLRPSPSYSNMGNGSSPQAACLIPYIRRLVVTGHDDEKILHGFFGDDWRMGIGPLHEVERRNYMFASRSANWIVVKQAYDMSQEETCPFLSPLKNVKEEELQATDEAWGEWLAQRDWHLGPRRPEELQPAAEPQVKREPRD